MPVEHYDGDATSPIEQLQFNGVDIDEGLYWDGSEYHTVYQPLGVIDDFEHNDIPQYYSDPSGTGTVDTDPSAAYSGDFGAEFEGERRIWSNPGQGLDRYPELGEWVEFYYYPVDASGNIQYWFAIGDANTDDWDDHYEIQALVTSDTFRVQKREGGTTTNMMDDGTSHDYSSQWYRIAFKPEEDQLRCRHYVVSSGERIDNMQVDEDTSDWSWPAKVGYRSNSNGHMYVDDVAHNPAEENA